MGCWGLCRGQPEVKEEANSSKTRYSFKSVKHLEQYMSDSNTRDAKKKAEANHTRPGISAFGYNAK